MSRMRERKKSAKKLSRMMAKPIKMTAAVVPEVHVNTEYMGDCDAKV